MLGRRVIVALFVFAWRGVRESCSRLTGEGVRLGARRAPCLEEKRRRASALPNLLLPCWVWFGRGWLAALALFLRAEAVLRGFFAVEDGVAGFADGDAGL